MLLMPHEPSHHRPTLQQYHAFHSMVCSPQTAYDCSQSFVGSGGTVLFIPSDYCSISSDNEHDGVALMSRFDSTTTINLVSYFLLVVVSLTGLSTLLGMTDVLDAREVDCGKGKNCSTSSASALLKSKLEPSVFVPESALSYIASQRGLADPSSIKLRRRFEYDFRLVGVNVIMFHFSSPKTGQLADNGEDEDEALHLVEVYRFRHSALRFIARMLLTAFKLVWTFFGLGLGAKEGVKIIYAGQSDSGIGISFPLLAWRQRKKND